MVIIFSNPHLKTTSRYEVILILIYPLSDCHTYWNLYPYWKTMDRSVHIFVYLIEANAYVFTVCAGTLVYHSETFWQ